MTDWQVIIGLIAVVTSVVGLPLSVLVYFIRHTRRQESQSVAQAHRRLDQYESAVRRLWETVADIRRDGVTKEEWVRESMWFRARLDEMRSVLNKLEAVDEYIGGLAVSTARMERSVQALGRERMTEPTESRDPEIGDTETK